MKTRPKTARFVVCLRDVTRDYCPNIRVATCHLKPELSRFFAAAVKACMDLLRNSACAIFGHTLPASHQRVFMEGHGAGLFKV